MMIHSLFTIHMLRPFHVFSNVLVFIEANWFMSKCSVHYME